MKKLIVLATLATLAALPTVALADVTISGELAVGIVNTKSAGHTVNSEDRTSGEIKFAGSDDLGNGLKAIWQIASRMNLADSADSKATTNQWAGRDSFVGLDGNFGRLTLGNIYHMPTSGKMAIFENNSATFKSDIYDQGDRVNNTVSYKTPSLNGFTATVQHSFGSSAASEDAKLYNQAMSLAYEGDGFALSYDGAREKLDNNGGKGKLHELNASVSLNDLSLMAGYARGSTKQVGVSTKTTGWGVAASYAMGNFTPKIGFWKENDQKVNGVTVNNGHKAYALGVDYALSKRSRAGFEWAKANFDSDATADVRTATIYLGTKF